MSDAADTVQVGIVSAAVVAVILGVAITVRGCVIENGIQSNDMEKERIKAGMYQDPNSRQWVYRDMKVTVVQGVEK